MATIPNPKHFGQSRHKPRRRPFSLVPAKNKFSHLFPIQVSHFLFQSSLRSGTGLGFELGPDVSENGSEETGLRKTI